jgi:hypothetical protein
MKLPPATDVVGCEPAPDALVLKIAVQAVCEVLVQRGVADEAGIELNRVLEQRRQILDELLREAAPA